MKRKNISSFTLLICVAVPSICFGWGAEGHKIVGQIAWDHLKPDVQRAVEALLGDDTFPNATVWADQIKSNPEFEWTRPLHYVNVEPGAEVFDLKRDCPEEGCVVSAIIRYTSVLRNRDATTPEKLEALKFIAHFVGDIHQPLHVSRARDRGGNDIRVFFFEDNTNLHRVWDSGLIRHTRKPWSEYSKELNRSITPRQLEQWQSTDPAGWATESYKIAVSNAYVVPSNGELRQDYFNRNILVVEERLKMAGVRLAVLLNDILSGD